MDNRFLFPFFPPASLSFIFCPSACFPIFWHHPLKLRSHFLYLFPCSYFGYSFSFSFHSLSIRDSFSFFSAFPPFVRFHIILATSYRVCSFSGICAKHEKSGRTELVDNFKRFCFSSLWSHTGIGVCRNRGSLHASVGGNADQLFCFFCPLFLSL